MRLAMISSAVIAAAGAIVLGVWSHGLAAPNAVPRLAQLERPMPVTEVDVELVLAVDVSYSMDPDEQALQREGYVAGLTSPEFLNALAPGHARQDRGDLFRMGGRRRPEDRRAVAADRRPGERADASPTRSRARRYRRAYRTSISGALLFAMPLFEAAAFAGCAG